MKYDFRTILTTAVVLLIANGVSPSATAAIYKWVDENGQTVYSETPPPRGTEAKRLKDPPQPSADPQKAMEELRERAEGFNSRREEDMKSEEQASREAERKKAQQERCKQLKANIDALSSGQRVRETTGEGERAFLNDNQIQERLKSTRQSYEKECNQN